MKTFTATTTIRATPEVDGRIGPGETLTVHKDTGPKVATVTVSAFELARRLAFCGTGGIPATLLKAERTYMLTTLDGGAGVEVTQRLVVTGIMAAAILKSVPDQQPVLEQVGAALKRRVEGT